MVLVAFKHVEVERRLMQEVSVPSPRIIHRLDHILYYAVFTHLLAHLQAMVKLVLTSKGDDTEALNNE